MKIAIVYDTVYGNTASVAKAIAETLAAAHDVRLATVQEAASLDLGDTDLLIVGSPTRGFRPTPNIAEFLGGLDRVGTPRAAAAFDTRIDLEAVNPAPLRWVVDAGGYAAARIGSALAQRGYVLKGGEAGFLVTGTEGPL
ncbi:MAG TPA: nitric oxide synthase, partial [Alphaproteobacteria bacterium]|nr:nitric oxide synthase [Alphaproteobacteria bacterium]